MQHTAQQIEEKIIKLLEYHLQVSKITDKNIDIKERYGADSLDIVEIVMDIEDEYKILLEEADYEKIATAQDAITLVLKYLDKKEKSPEPKTKPKPKPKKKSWKHTHTIKSTQIDWELPVMIIEDDNGISYINEKEYAKNIRPIWNIVNGVTMLNDAPAPVIIETAPKYTLAFGNESYPCEVNKNRQEIIIQMTILNPHLNYKVFQGWYVLTEEKGTTAITMGTCCSERPKQQAKPVYISLQTTEIISENQVKVTLTYDK